MAKPWHAMNTNIITPRNVYPTANGPTLGQASGAQNPQSFAGQSERAVSNASAVAGAASAPSVSGPLGQPITWWIALIGALFGLMYFAQRVGDDSDFGNIRMSLYNVLTISLAAVIGIVFLKVLFNRFPVPGLTDLVSAV